MYSVNVATPFAAHLGTSGIMLRLYAIGFCATLFIGLAQSAFAEEISGKTVVATVGESEITIGHMIAMAQSLPPEQL